MADTLSDDVFGGVEIGGAPSGYSATDDYFATDFRQEGLTLLSVQMHLGVLVRSVKVPDPDNPTDTNRRVNRKHAADFGDYLVDADTPYVPPIVLWTAPDNVDREVLRTLPDGTKFVMAKFDKLAAQERDILDGQHRILGVHLKLQELTEAIARVRDQISKAKKNETPEVVAELEKELQRLKDAMKRVSAITVTVQILLTADHGVVKQVFADVADNAMGINKSVLTDFDQRQVFNRVASSIAQTDLRGVVDWEKARISKSSSMWLTLKDVATVAQALEMPVGSRWSPKLEERFSEGAVLADTRQFFDAVAAAYPNVADVIAGELDPATMRDPLGEASLLGSTTVVRVLAHAARELVLVPKAPLMWEEFSEFCEQELPMQAGYVPDPKSDEPEEGTPKVADVWLQTEKFGPPWVAPTARAQDIKALVKHLVTVGAEWADAETAAA